MPAPPTRGLTLGKFALLHQGHQYLIETALTETDEVVVIIFDAPETTHVPLNVRASWLRRLYPTVRVVEAWDGPTGVGDTPELRQVHEEYVMNRLKIRGITHFYSSEFYGDHMSRALGAIDRRVDRARAMVPVLMLTLFALRTSRSRARDGSRFWDAGPRRSLRLARLCPPAGVS